MSNVTNTPNLPHVPQLLVPADLQHGLSWLQKHERIVIVSLVLLFGSLGIHHLLINQASAAAARATIAEQALAVAKSQSAQNAVQTAQVEAQYQALTETLTKQNAALAASVAARQVTLVQQQSANASLPVPELGKRLQALAGVKDADISADMDGVKLTPIGALTTVNSLETIPVLRADLADTKAVVANLTSEITVANNLIDTQGRQIVGLKSEIVVADTASKAEIASLKAQARKGKFNWFFRGVVVGFVGGLVIHGGL
jgi:hypothetical protein